MKFLVFQHLEMEHPGIFRDFFTEDGIKWTAVELDQGESIPALDDYDALWVMGGPMNVWHEDRYPWLKDEKAAIKEAVLELELPFMGICLGHQLLASALGGEVVKGEHAEVGIMNVEKTDAGKLSPFFTGLPDPVPTLQWHGAEVITPPAGALVLAESPLCPIQSMSIGSHVLTTQFHVEITKDTVSDWASIEEYRMSLDKALGEGGSENLKQTASEQLAVFNQNARLLYENWKKTTGLAV